MRQAPRNFIAYSFGWSLLGGVAALCGSQAEAASLSKAPEYPAIKGGREAAVCEWAGVISIESSEAYCTGTLIHPQVVAYAAHCGDQVYEIRLGEDTFDPGQTLFPERCEINSGFGPGLGNDFAFCVLSEPVDDVAFIPPLVGCEAESLLELGTPVTMVGFGRDDDDYLGNKRIVEDEIRALTWDEVFVGRQGATGCQGDSGGPALVQADDGSWRVFGVVSWGPIDCDDGGYYGRMDRAVEWIERRTNIDVTPCHDARGNWDPGPECGSFPLEPDLGHGEWEEGCGVGPVTGLSDACGPAFDPEQEDTTPPEVSFVQPVEGQYRKVWLEGESANLPIEVALDDGEGLGGDEVLLQVLDGEMQLQLELQRNSAPFAFDELSFTPGQWFIRAVGSDRAGNRAEAWLSIGLSAEPPELPELPDTPPTEEGGESGSEESSPDPSSDGSSHGGEGDGEPSGQDSQSAEESGSESSSEDDDGQGGCDAGSVGSNSGPPILGGSLLFLGLLWRRRRFANPLLRSAACGLFVCSVLTSCQGDGSSSTTGASIKSERSETSESGVEPSSPNTDGSDAQDQMEAGEVESGTGIEPDPDLLAGCGNGIVEVGESCDDGNDISKDGCSPECQLSGEEIWWKEFDGVYSLRAIKQVEGAADSDDGDQDLMFLLGLQDSEDGTEWRGWVGAIDADGKLWTTITVELPQDLQPPVIESEGGTSESTGTDEEGSDEPEDWEGLEQNVWPKDLFVASDGTIFVGGEASIGDYRTRALWKYSAKGELLAFHGEWLEDEWSSWMQLSSDGAGGVVAVGEAGPEPSESEFLIERFDADLERLWSHSELEADGIVWGQSVAMNKNGNPVALGSHQAKRRGKASIWLREYDLETGEPQWTQTSGYPVWFFWAHDLAISEHERIAVAGQVTGFGEVAYTAELTADGVLQYATPYSLEGFTQTTAEAIRIDPKQSANSHSLVFAGYAYSMAGGVQAIVGRADAEGQLIWGRALPQGERRGAEYAEDLTVLSDGSILVVGERSTNPADYGVGFVAKLVP